VSKVQGFAHRRGLWRGEGIPHESKEKKRTVSARPTSREGARKESARTRRQAHKNKTTSRGEGLNRETGAKVGAAFLGVQGRWLRGVRDGREDVLIDRTLLQRKKEGGIRDNTTKR